MSYNPILKENPVLVFGLSGQIGSGVSFVRDKLTQAVTSYGYIPVIIDVSRNIIDEVSKRRKLYPEEDPDFKDASMAVRRVRNLQLKGNLLRKKIGTEVVATIAVSIIHQWLEDNGWDERVAFTIDSLKHPDEVRFLREVFGPSFYSMGVVTNSSIRMDRLMSQKGYTEALPGNCIQTPSVTPWSRMRRRRYPSKSMEGSHSDDTSSFLGVRRNARMTMGGLSTETENEWICFPVVRPVLKNSTCEWAP